MSTAHDAHVAAAEHDAHEAFTGEPVTVLPADEPRTPGWLPLLGVALFTGAAVVFLTSFSSSPDAAQPAQAQPTTEPVAAAVPQPAPQAMPARPPAEPIRVPPPSPQQARRVEVRPQGPNPPQPAPPPARHP